jgi:hypothetical protein
MKGLRSCLLAFLTFKFSKSINFTFKEMKTFFLQIWRMAKHTDFKQALDLHRPCKILSQISGRQNHWSLISNLLWTLGERIQ